MILNPREVYGLRVYSLEDGRREGEVAVLTYDPKELKVRSLLVKGDGLADDLGVIMFQNIISFGLDAVIIESRRQLIKIQDVREDLGEILKDPGTSFDSKTGKIRLFGTPKYFSGIKNK